MEARCVGEGLVETVGVEQLQGYGMLTDDLQVLLDREHHREARPDQRLVVDEQHPQPPTHESPPERRGIRARTR